MSTRPIYLDYAATTPIDPRVAEVMSQYLTADQDFGNAASMQHDYGRAAHAAVEEAREQVANLIGAEPAEIVWTSGATESNNLAIKGVAESYADRGRHIISMKTEHKSVVDTLRYMEQQGWRVTWLMPDDQGRLSLEELKKAISDDTVLVSIMMVNNETGVIQDIRLIAEMAHAHGALLHVDAAQAVGKIPVNVKMLDLDLLSISAHKLYGPKGVGALYVRRQPRVRLLPQMHGGGHERGMRSGTLPVHQIVGMGKACALLGEEFGNEAVRISKLRDQLWQGISLLPDVFRNGSDKEVAPGILNISFGGVDGEALHAGLSGMSLPIAISSGSACTAASQEASYVLRALGRDDELAYASVRFSLGRWTTDSEIYAVVEALTELVNALRRQSPKWDIQTECRLPEMSGTHAQYSDAVWQNFVKGLNTAWEMPETAFKVICNTPGSRAVMKLVVLVEQEVIVSAQCQVFGCVTAIAVGAWLSAWLKGRQVAGLDLSAAEIEQALSVAPVKRHCTLLAEDALRMFLQVGRQSNGIDQLVAS